jgi:hypothetical protein
MKVRTGFVSNSSTSSYVIVGFLANDSWKYFPSEEEQDDAYSNGNMIYDDDGGYMIGETIANVHSDNMMHDQSISLDELLTTADEICEKYKVDREHIHLFMGTRQS